MGIWLCGQHFAGMVSGPLVLLEGRVTSNQCKVVLSDYLYHVINKDRIIIPSYIGLEWSPDGLMDRKIT